MFLQIFFCEIFANVPKRPKFLLTFLFFVEKRKFVFVYYTFPVILCAYLLIFLYKNLFLRFFMVVYFLCVAFFISVGYLYPR